MKRLVFIAGGIIIFGMMAGAVTAYAQGTFKIPFKFQVGGNKLQAGEYLVGQKDDQHIFLRQISTGTEVLADFNKRLEQPKPPVTEPQIVFDMVGNFEPSYTEYMTEYRLAELWLPGQDGFEVSLLKGAHGHQTVKGQSAKR
jgi:hypothetical protein